MVPLEVYSVAMMAIGNTMELILVVCLPGAVICAQCNVW